MDDLDEIKELYETKGYNDALMDFTQQLKKEVMSSKVINEHVVMRILKSLADKVGDKIKEIDERK